MMQMTDLRLFRIILILANLTLLNGYNGQALHRSKDEETILLKILRDNASGIRLKRADVNSELRHDDQQDVSKLPLIKRARRQGNKQEHWPCWFCNMQARFTSDWAEPPMPPPIIINKDCEVETKGGPTFEWLDGL